MFVLDTNVLSELRAGKPNQSPAVRAWAARVRPEEMYLTSISVFEMEAGILRLERRSPPQGQAIRTWFDTVRGHFAERILPFSADAALICAALHIPDPMSMADSMIAAIALEHGFTVVTRNSADFAASGVKLIDPWATAGPHFSHPPDFPPR